jgi:hypothetical protein
MYTVHTVEMPGLVSTWLFGSDGAVTWEGRCGGLGGGTRRAVAPVFAAVLCPGWDPAGPGCPRWLTSVLPYSREGGTWTNVCAAFRQTAEGRELCAYLFSVTSAQSDAYFDQHGLG